MTGALNAAGIDFLEFRSSEIAAAVAISVSKEMQANDIDKAMPCFIHVQKVKFVGAPHFNTVKPLYNSVTYSYNVT